jgi:hypothetical protein
VKRFIWGTGRHVDRREEEVSSTKKGKEEKGKGKGKK